VGLDKNPITLTANYDFKFDSVPLGIGVGYMHDQLGSMESDRAYLNLSYISNLNFGTISIGASAVYNQMSQDWSHINGIYPNDPLIPTGIVSQSKLNYNVGLFLKTKVFEVGISSSQINEPTYDQIFFTNTRHYFVLVAYNFKLSNLLQLKSSLYAKVGGSVIFDLNNLITYNNKYWTGHSKIKNKFFTNYFKPQIYLVQHKAFLV
jgi:type IX secretion system PorP/SprF family membrane protein